MPRLAARRSGQRPDLAQELDRAGLAVGAGDRDHGRRLRPGQQRRRSARAGGAVRDPRSAAAAARRAASRVPGRRQHRGGAARDRVGDEPPAVGARARQRREQEAGPTRRLSAVMPRRSIVPTRARRRRRRSGSARMSSASRNGRDSSDRLVPHVARAPRGMHRTAAAAARPPAAWLSRLATVTPGSRRRLRRPRQRLRATRLPPGGRPGCSGMASDAWIAGAFVGLRQQAEHRADPRDHPAGRRRAHPAGGRVAVACLAFACGSSSIM